MAGDERRQRAGDILLPVCRRREKLQLGARIMPHQTAEGGGDTATAWGAVRQCLRPAMNCRESTSGMIGRLLRPTSIVRLAATTMTKLCDKMIKRSPATVVAHPGVARLVLNRIATIATIPITARTATSPIANNNRTKIASLWTDIALSPCTTSDTEFIREEPS